MFTVFLIKRWAWKLWATKVGRTIIVTDSVQHQKCKHLFHTFQQMLFQLYSFDKCNVNKYWFSEFKMAHKSQFLEVTAKKMKLFYKFCKLGLKIDNEDKDWIYDEEPHTARRKAILQVISYIQGHLEYFHINS